MKRANYAKSNDGIVHLVSSLNSEFTLCWDAFDGGVIGNKVDESIAWTFINEGPVTCERCISEIKNCRDQTIKIK